MLQRVQALTQHRFRLVPVRSPLLGESHFDFYSSGYLDVSVPQVRYNMPMYSACVGRYKPARVFPFGDLRLKACVAAPRSFSQLPTSFIASWHQGIHRMPLVA